MQDDDTNKVFYAEGNDIRINEMTVEEKTANPGKDLKVTVSEPVDGSDEYKDVDYFITSDYTIYGGSESGECEGVGIFLESGTVKTIVAGGKEDTFTNTASIIVTGGTVETIKCVENGSVCLVDVSIEGDSNNGSAPEIGSIIVGAGEGESGTIESFRLEDLTDSITATVTAGYSGGISMVEALKGGEFYGEINISGNSLNVEQFENLPQCFINKKQYVCLHAGEGTFEGGDSEKYESVDITEEVTDEGTIYTCSVNGIAAKPEREGYTFMGWSPVEDPMVDDLLGSEDNIHYQFDLYAVWADKPVAKVSCSMPDNAESYEEYCYFEDNVAEVQLPYGYDSCKPVALQVTHLNGTVDDPKEITISDGVGAATFTSEVNGKDVEFTVKVSVAEPSSDVGVQLWLEAWDGKTVDDNDDPVIKVINIDCEEAAADNGVTVTIPYASKDATENYAELFVDPWDSNATVTGYGGGYDNDTYETFGDPVTDGATREITITAQDGTTETYNLKFVASDGKTTDVYMEALFIDTVCEDNNTDEDAPWNNAWLAIEFEEADDKMVADVTLPNKVSNEDGDDIELYWDANDYITLTYDTAFDDRIYLDDDGKATVEFTVTSPDGKETQKYVINFIQDPVGDSADLKSLTLVCEENGEKKRVPLSITDAASETGVTVFLPEEARGFVAIEVYTKNCATIVDRKDPVRGSGDYGYMYQEYDLSEKSTQEYIFSVQSSNGLVKKPYKVTVTIGEKAQESIEGKTVNGLNASYTYTGSQIKPTVTIAGLKQGTDFTVEYGANTNVGTGTVTIKGIGNYNGTIPETFTITPMSIAGKTVSGINDEYTYTGSQIRPTVTIAGLKEGTDFTVAYSANTDVGTATVTVDGIGNYNGTITKTFAIVKALPAKGTVLKDAGNKAKYKVTKSAAGDVQVTYTAPTNKKKTSVTIPATVKLPDGTVAEVTAINDKAFKNNKKVKKITIGKNVENVGKEAFSGCKNLNTVKMGKSVKNIGNNAFAKCPKLKAVTIPSKVTKIGNKAFSGCKNLKNITIKTTKLTNSNVGKQAFKGVSPKAKVRVPKSKVKAYKKLFVKKGLPKKAKVTK